MDDAREEAQEGAWFGGLADELAQALIDAGACADECEKLLDASSRLPSPEQRQRLLGALVAAAAICSVLDGLLDRPPQLVLAGARFCRRASLDALERLDLLAPPLESGAATAALARVAESCGRLLDAAGEL